MQELVSVPQKSPILTLQLFTENPWPRAVPLSPGGRGDGERGTNFAPTSGHLAMSGDVF